ncbi:hypothetical protein [Phycisphaera mikurensis]|uniref:Uncharacterized protein n=1 Tax=Phycisphaera mikurensis (strain NBRC 102666 / KCTC 22515 / FYK2301M01) TaxID=1142394 RepID=I0IEK3_PHYMF|nr:hypothetical protein [Phycisphaera mikurensis]MBB6441490.1 hypothetical protein [Phycisphaera mikurensis]BAM03691.1 hypothetical protein PSMK_15320 [Phycisphaera mikurensis NBRC 102666]
MRKLRPLLACLALLSTGPVSAQPARATPAPAADAPASSPLAAAYAVLTAGRTREAELAFLRLAATAGPGDAGALLGAGLAAAAAGDAGPAVKRLRAVLRLGPGGALRGLPPRDDLLGVVTAGRTNLENGLMETDDVGGVLVSSALLDFLVGDLETARLSLAAAVRRDGMQPEMRSLDRLLQNARLGLQAEGVQPTPRVTPPAAPREVARAPAPELALESAPESAPEPAPGLASEPPAAPRLLRPVNPGEDAERPRIFFDYEKLNLRVSEMAGSLESFEKKLMQSLMREAPPPAPDAAASPAPAAP